MMAPLIRMAVAVAATVPMAAVAMGEVMTKHVVALSGGKDSTALALRLHVINPKIGRSLSYTNPSSPIRQAWRNRSDRFRPPKSDKKMHGWRQCPGGPLCAC